MHSLSTMHGVAARCFCFSILGENFSLVLPEGVLPEGKSDALRLYTVSN